MEAFFLKKIPVNYRTVLFCLSASGATSFPMAFVLHGLGYGGFDPGNPVGTLAMITAFVETLALPVASVLFLKIEPTIGSLGVIMFFVVFCGFLLFPAVS